MNQPDPIPRPRIRWSALVFLLLFTGLLAVVVSYALIPGMEAAKHATTEEKPPLVAWYRLLLAVILFTLLAGLMVTFRFGRLFFPRPIAPRTKTEYVDAWAESAKRIEVPPRDEDQTE
jgi:hypothetical protein